MKNLFLILFLFFYTQINAQVKDLYGTWNTVEISESRFTMNSEKQFQLTAKGKKIYKSHKDALKDFEIKFSENQFVFNEDNSFEFKLSEKTDLNVFEGNFDIDETNQRINLKNLKNNILRNKEKYINYKFEKDILIIEIYIDNVLNMTYKLKKV
ncbi:hypothetical protein [Chishuiella changwenlii]|uniref:hypothetical protein n=1 Tax=Chishuiella changwenlii TaxID=1434701 RepID=UPI002FD9A26B